MERRYLSLSFSEKMSNSASSLLALSLFCGVVVCTKQYVQIIQATTRETELSFELNKQKKLREDERKARISMQRQKRDDVNNKDKDEGFHYQPIAFAESPFPDRRGTPRQPLLVPAARGFIRFQKHLVQLAHFEELKDFSHVWVLFVFHENTNTDKAHDNTSKQVLAKIKPPRLHGKKVGCLSTRSPHRPNNIGLSVCEVLSIGNDYIEVKGMDLVNGTPIVDVKPYIPYDIVPSEYILPMATSADGQQLPLRNLHVPEWVVEADIPMRPVYFTTEAETDLQTIFPQNNQTKPTKSRKQNVHISQTLAEARELIQQVLRQDIRSHHQGRGQVSEERKNNCTNENAYSCTLDGLQLSFQHLQDGIWVDSVHEIDFKKHKELAGGKSLDCN